MIYKLKSDKIAVKAEGVDIMKRSIEQQLCEWKASNNRKPLILNGARQVGKTYLLREFGEKYYKNVVYVNLEPIHR